MILKKIHSNLIKKSSLSDMENHTNKMYKKLNRKVFQGYFKR